MDHQESESSINLMIRTRLLEIWNSNTSITQKQAAEQMGMGQPAISNYLTGYTALNTNAIIKFAKVLNVLPSDIDPNLNWDTFLTQGD